MSSKIIAYAGSAVAEMVGRCVKISFVTHVFKQSEINDFLKVLEELRAKGFTRCIIDLSECEYISSEGLGATAQLWQWCQC